MDFGHFDTDLIKGKNIKSFKLTITKKLTNLDYICHLDNKATNTVNIKLINFFKNPAIMKYYKSLVLDNGSEFTMWKEFAQMTSIPFYFTTPDLPWEKALLNTKINYYGKI
ncbi:hypothetical protein [Spiroplasma phoeniceum]|uniref:Transposase, IS30 family n=1 Tax=Spiroplasma phoeniceum P40 TaxID=1276259 RepID=A0A345DRE8_9MOLU|nr:hypothetical protein [Spiroplasma phoeniceum]AXF96789.1 transposase, IS30 family [Spiroplasma phoeniceum P40]